MKKLIIATFTLFCMACGSSEESQFLEGKWIIAEMYSSGVKGSSQGWITFNGDGTYSAKMQSDEDTRDGEWKVVGDVVHLLQAEIRDLNGNRYMEPFESTWNYDVVGNYLVLEGLPDHGFQEYKLILEKSEDL